MKMIKSKFQRRIFAIALVFAGVFGSENSSGTDLAVTFNVSKYQNGNNISCFGAHDGMVEAVIVGGTSPYTYSWNTGSFNRVLTGIGSGTYTFTVTDASAQTVSSSVGMIEPAILELTLLPELYGGYNISEQGGNDGKIISEIKGGSQPYSYSWSTTSTEPNIIGLTAGAYNLSVTDANGCTISGSKTLTEPTPLHIVSITSLQHHGYNVSCNEGHDGQIDLNVTGGVPPYKYDWNTGSFEEDIINLSAGEYSVRVTDANGAEILTSILLTEPTGTFKINMTPQVYANGFNLSCHDCANGSITAIGVNGVSPFTYLWSNSQTTATISGLQAIDYSCMLIDANGCSAKAALALHAPDRDDWSMNGNANVDSATQFMGTTDGKSFIFKTNNVERMRINSLGGVNITKGLNVDSVNINSKLKIGGKFAMGYQAATVNSPEILSFGKMPSTSPYRISSCSTPLVNVLPNYQFGGTIQVYGDAYGAPGLYNILELGFDGMNSIIEAQGNSGDANGNRLLLNNYCGRDVFVGNNVSGDLTANHNMFVLGNLGIGNTTPQEKLDVLGMGRFTSLASNQNYLNVGHNGTSSFIEGFGGTSLAINQQSEKNVEICTGAAGDVEVGGNLILASKRGRVFIGGAANISELQLGSKFTLRGDDANSIIGSNYSFYSSIDKRLIDGGASRIIFGSSGDILMETAAFGAANSTILPADWNATLNLKNGSVGINTSAPSSDFKLDVNGGVEFVQSGNTGCGFQIVGGVPEGRGIGIDEPQDGNFNFYLDNYQNGSFRFMSNVSGTFRKLLTINGENGVAIGEGTDDFIPTGTKLAVHGKITCEEVLVKWRSEWPDYVFKPDYKLRSLVDLQKYIDANSHLPGLPSSQEIGKSGLGLAEIIGKQTLKIEELTLYVLDLQKQITELRKQSK